MRSTRRGRRGGRGWRGGRGKGGSASNTTAKKVTKSSESHDHNFEQRMVDNGIYPDKYEYRFGGFLPNPENRKEIVQKLVKRRASLSPSVYSEEKFRDFRRANARATSGQKASVEVIPIIQRATSNPKLVGRNIPFYNLNPMMAGTHHSAKPKIYYGARPEQLDRAIREDSEEEDDKKIRKKLGKYIVPSSIDNRPIAPNFFVEVKSENAAGRVAMHQACFAGAVGARGIHKLQTYGQTVPTYDNKAYTLSATYYAGALTIYAHHLGQPNGPGTKPKYYMKLLNAYAMTGNRESFRQGVTAFRNGVDWAEKQRNAAIKHAQAVANRVTNDDNTDEEEDEENADEDNETADEEDEIADEEDEENADEEDKIDDEDDEVTVAAKSPFSTEQIIPRRSRVAYQESDTSADELNHLTSQRSE